MVIMRKVSSRSRAQDSLTNRIAEINELADIYEVTKVAAKPRTAQPKSEVIDLTMDDDDA